MTKSDCIKIISPELTRFANVVDYKFDGNSKSVFWKLFYSRYKDFIWSNNGLLYTITPNPYELIQLNPERYCVLLNTDTSVNIQVRIFWSFFWITWLIFSATLGSKHVVSWCFPIFLIIYFTQDMWSGLIYKFRFKILHK